MDFRRNSYYQGWLELPEHLNPLTVSVNPVYRCWRLFAQGVRFSTDILYSQNVCLIQYNTVKSRIQESYIDFLSFTG